METAIALLAPAGTVMAEVVAAMLAALVAGAVKVDGESGSSVGDVGEGDGEKGAGVSGITVYQASGASGIWTPPRFSRVGTEGMSEQQAKPKEHGGKNFWTGCEREQELKTEMTAAVTMTMRSVPVTP